MIVKVYIIGGDGTQKGANAIYEVSFNDGVKHSVQML